jgi:hypothetical protein
MFFVFFFSKTSQGGASDFPRPKPLVSPSPRNPLRGEEMENLEKPVQTTPHFSLLFIQHKTRYVYLRILMRVCVALAEGTMARRRPDPKRPLNLQSRTPLRVASLSCSTGLGWVGGAKRRCQEEGWRKAVCIFGSMELLLPV